MPMLRLRMMVLAIAVVGLTAASAGAQPQRRRPGRSYPPQLPGAEVEVYKAIGDVELNMYIFKPEGHRPDDRRPAIVFFFGGGWRFGSPAQYRQQCRYLASRGMVAMTADYRVASRHGTTPLHCVRDARSAVRWVRANAERLSVDPRRIAAAGGSAGGHIAACAAIVEGPDEPGEEASISSAPDALVLFNPVMAMAPIDPENSAQRRLYERARRRLGGDPKAISPYHHVGPDQPPAIMFFGTNDGLLHAARRFAEASRQAGNRCELMIFPGQGHGFANYGRDENKPFIETMRAADRFLASLGYIEGEPTIDDWLGAHTGPP